MQAHAIAQFVQESPEPPKAIAAVDTAQAIATGLEISRMSGVQFERVLSLQPVGLGVADGLSNAELRQLHPQAFEALDRFRSRVISAAELEIPDAEGATNVRARLDRWWEAEGAHALPNRLIVGSNSTILMLAHRLCGTDPTSAGYRCLRVPNATLRTWVEIDGQWVLEGEDLARSWPDRGMHFVSTRLGLVACTEHFPSWAPTTTALAVVPGYFGSSRHGPYGLYNRLARAWAELGHRTVTLDPLGSGDSSDVQRTFASEVESVVAVGRQLLERAGRLVLVGHSLGTATVLAAREALGAEGGDVLVWGLAPLVSFEDVALGFFTPTQLAELDQFGTTTRHGLALSRAFIEDAERNWFALKDRLDAAWVGDADPYITAEVIARIPNCALSYVPGADHNFSATGNVEVLSEETLALLQ